MKITSRCELCHEKCSFKRDYKDNACTVCQNDMCLFFNIAHVIGSPLPKLRVVNTNKILTITGKGVSVNDMRRGRTFLTTAYRSFKRDAVMELIQQRPQKNLGKDIHVKMTFHMSKLFTCDLSNFVKIVEDACTEAGVWEDDRYITELHLYKVKGLTDKVEIEIL